MHVFLLLFGPPSNMAKLENLPPPPPATKWNLPRPQNNTNRRLRRIQRRAGNNVLKFHHGCPEGVTVAVFEFVFAAGTFGSMCRAAVSRKPSKYPAPVPVNYPCRGTRSLDSALATSGLQGTGRCSLPRPRKMQRAMTVAIVSQSMRFSIL